MNPQKKLLQLELAKEMMLAEISGRRSAGNTQGLDYLKLYQVVFEKASAITDFMEEEATRNLQEWQTQQGVTNPEVLNEEE